MGRKSGTYSRRGVATLVDSAVLRAVPGPEARVGGRGVAVDGLALAPDTAIDLHRLREAMREAHLVPISDSPTAYRVDTPREPAHRWAWCTVRAILDESLRAGSASFTERKVYSLVNPASGSALDEATTGLLSAGVQLLSPGESARPHRHSMNALRFVLEGSGAETIVDGERCAMEPGDLVITPGWSWHEHVSHGEAATIWVDVLDFALHLALGTNEFEPGPPPAAGSPAPPFAKAGIGACHEDGAGRRPILRYAFAEVAAALDRAPAEPDGSRQVSYVNSLTGLAVMPTLDCMMAAYVAGRPTRPFRSTASTLCIAVEGEGASEIDGQRLAWERNDIFTIPARSWSSHCAASPEAKLFQVSNRPVYQSLGLLSESYEG